MVTYSAADVIHLQPVEYPGQVIGEPILCAASEHMHHIGQFLTFELQAADHNSRFFGVVKSAARGIIGKIRSNSDSTAGDNSTINRQIATTEVGTILDLGEGAEYQQVRSDRPGAGFPVIVKASMRWISRGVTVPYSLLSGDTEGENYTRGKLAMGEMELSTVEWGELVRDDLVAGVWERFVQTSIFQGLLSLVPGIDATNHFHARYRMPGTRVTLDPVKDREGNKRALLNMETTPQRLAIEQGEDFEELVEEWADNIALLERHGMKDFFFSALGVDLNPPAQEPVEAGMEEEEDEPEDAEEEDENG